MEISFADNIYLFEHKKKKKKKLTATYLITETA